MSVDKKSETDKGLGINAKTFITALVIIFVLMCLTYAATFLIPGGVYDRIPENGMEVIDTGSFRYVDGGLPFWKWLLSPLLVLGAEGSGAIIAVIAFLLVIGGIFNALDKCGLMKYMLDRIVHRFGHARYRLLALVILFFMSMGAFIGSLEECVPMVPIVVGLAVALGWDELTGLGMSLLAIGCGFASGVCNPFTVGVAQKLAGLPMFSGMGFRLLAFAVIYGMVWFFVTRHAKKIERPVDTLQISSDFVQSKGMDRALLLFVSILGCGLLLVFSSVFLTVLQDYTMIIVALMFLIAGLAAVAAAGMSAKTLCVHFWNGITSILPAVLMILMASSIKFTLTEANILDTMLHFAVGVAEKLPSGVMILFIYLIVLVMNFFISSGSAKAFLLIPIIVPLAQIFQIPAQLTIMAFAFGDGFSNILYPTNPVTLISIGLVNVSYVKWFKWIWKFQAAIAVVTGLLLVLGLAIGYC